MRHTLALTALLAITGLFAFAKSAFPQAAQVRVWADSNPKSYCEHAQAPTEEWLVHNYTNHAITVVLNRSFNQGVQRTEDHPQYSLAPGQTLSLGCHTWIGISGSGSQSYSVNRIY